MVRDDVFVVITWPESQRLLEKPGFVDNSVLINDYPLLEEYGAAAYLVRETWLQGHDECDASEVDSY